MRVILETPIGPLGVDLDGETVIGVRFGASPAWASAPGEAGAASSGEVGAASSGEAGASEDAGVSPPGEVGAPAGGDGHAGEAARRVLAELGGYFSGTLTEFSVPMEIRGGSDFERAVWEQIASIPYGEMRTYGAIATALGDPGAARAVGTACNRNPVPVIVPCHRVVGAGGKLVGFGGGLPRKRQLLELEARVALERAWS